MSILSMAFDDFDPLPAGGPGAVPPEKFLIFEMHVDVGEFQCIFLSSVKVGPTHVELLMNDFCRQTDCSLCSIPVWRFSDEKWQYDFKTAKEVTVWHTVPLPALKLI